MSFLTKIKNLTSLLASATSNFGNKLNGGERYLSKRFTIGKNCKPAPKKKPCDNSEKTELKRKTKSKQSAAGSKCEPFPKKEKIKGKKKLRKCKPGMKNLCSEVTCKETCTLTKATKTFTVDDCPLERSQNREQQCPKGDWQREK